MKGRDMKNTNMATKKVKKPKLGSGKRFAALAKSAGGGKKGAAIAAAAGIKKYGKAKMAKMAKAGKKRKSK